MPEKAKTESSLVARRGGALLGPVKSSRGIGKKTSSSSPTKRKSSTPLTHQPATPTAFKGVRMRAWGKWVTEIRDPETRNRIWLGSFSTPEMAARAYDAAVVCLKGESAIASLNFPDSPPQIPHQPSKSPKDIQAVAAAAATSSVPAAKPLCIPLPTQPSPEASVASLYSSAPFDLYASLNPSALASDDHQGMVAEVKDSMIAALHASNPPQNGLAAEEVPAEGDFWTNALAGEPVDPKPWFLKEPEAVDAIPAYDLEPSSFEIDYSFNLVAELWAP